LTIQNCLQWRGLDTAIFSILGTQALQVTKGLEIRLRVLENIVSHELQNSFANSAIKVEVNNIRKLERTQSKMEFGRLSNAAW
jgi:hypothetical protein